MKEYYPPGGLIDANLLGMFREASRHPREIYVCEMNDVTIVMMHK